MDYSNLRARARENLRGRWGISIGAMLIAGIFGATMASGGVDLNFNIDTNTLEYLPEHFVALAAAVAGVLVSAASTLNFLHLILGGVIQLGYAKFLLAQHDGKEYQVKDLFSQFDRFGVGFLQSFLRGLYVFLWTLLFIIPGIIKQFSYAMTPYILADHPELTAKQAIEASKTMMDGYKGDLFVLGLTFLGWDILNVFTLGIGSFWLNPYKEAAYAAFYRQLLAEHRETSVE